MSTTNHRHHHLLGLLLREWEDAHAPIGPAKYLQVQELLRQTPTDLPLEQWRGRLAPLFCRNPQEQELFYITFERCLQALKAIDPVEELPLSPPDPIEPNPKVEQAKKRWQASLYWLLAAVVGLLILIWFFRKKEAEVTAVDPVRLARIERLSLAPGDTLNRNLRPADDTSTLRSATPRDWQATPLGGLYRVDSTGLASYIANRDAEVGAVDTALILYDLSTGRDSVYWLADIIEPQKPVEIDTGLIAELPLPYPNNAAEFASLAINEKAQARYEWYRRWQWPLKAALWLLLGALAWAIVRWDQYRRAKVVAELQRPERAPYIWSPETGIQAEDFLRADAAPLLTRLRGRSPDERERLDLRATLFASIRAGGRIQLRYRRSTLPPDYLLLIDRHDGQDHRARLFEALYQVFVQAEAPVSRYFYDGDPRTCFNERYSEGVALNELLQRHAGAQLLLLGEGQALLSNLSGRLAPWTSLLEAWPRRALLLTRPIQSWGRREKELQKLLPLLPASPAGLSAAIDLFNAPEPLAILPDLLRNVPDALQKPISFEHELIPDLQRQFSPELLDWIAACALWPTLHWDLTLYLGKVLEGRRAGENGPKSNGETASMLSFAGIRELTRLPWFVEGRIPDTVRLTLIRYLQELGLEQPLRQALATLLQQAPPPPADSVAYDEYRLNLIVNELFLRPDAQRKLELEREFAQYLAAGKQPDFVALQVLNRPQTALDVLVGDRLKKYAFKGGLPGLGWQLWTKLLGIWLACGLGIAFIQPFRSPCTGEKVQYQQQTYCLKDSRDQLLYLEKLAADAIDAREYPRVDSLVQAADALVPLDSAFYLNTATRYYNAGAGYFNCGKLNNCIGLSADSARQIACTHFRQGAALAQRRLGQPGLEYYLAQQRACIPQRGDEPSPAPADTSFVIQGTVLDALSQSPIAGAQVRLNGQGARSDRNGQYQFRVRASSLGNRLELQASADEYEPLRLSTPPQNTLPPLRLRPLNTSPPSEAVNTAPETNNSKFEEFGRLGIETLPRVTRTQDGNNSNSSTDSDRLNLKTGFFLSKEMSFVYPVVKMPLYFPKDRPILQIEGGVFTHDNARDQDIYGDQFKVLQNNLRGSKLTVDNKRGTIEGEGKINIGSALKYVKIDAAGSIKSWRQYIPDSLIGKTEPPPVDIDVISGLSMLIPEKLMRIMQSEIEAVTFGSETVNYLTNLPYYQRRLSMLFPANANMDKAIADLSTGMFQLPLENNTYNFLISGLKMRWDMDYQSFVSTGYLNDYRVGLISINGQMLNKVITMYAEYKMPSNDDDRVYIYLKLPNDIFYYFGYKNNILELTSNDSRFMDQADKMKKKDFSRKMSDGGTLDVQVVEGNRAWAFVQRVKTAGRK